MSKTVADVMTSNPIVVQPQTPIKEAIQLLAERRISGLPVVDGEGKLVGVITESDLMWQETGVDPPPYIILLDSVIYLQNPARYEKEIHKALGQTVEEVMSEKPITVEPDRALKEAARLMHEKEIRRLPVVDEQGQVIGILTRGDIVQAMVTE
ncbi:MAG: phosphoribulokinase [Cyanobacteria bacterium QH_8_48_120]|jgi:CBS domain-containing protein|nr:MAG: phosphoribulokinase [Cyanobacteria bacterium QH_1_48_107]PSO58024.1 MAG: phosphoribulokinase [Cyanobacteria bacterium QH_10_48_56]PSO63905.1 MAG: phosphoribulokinase [Cyanobacteria bacterium QH_7_48_89]PSO65512.1 MAG: phosphoribulokinase [Cyanobacteria bacterium QH_6_48_35]PSO69263.1 MAG: phosphoribulokinase [Cyanobacteria bacterium QS_1_48_34]PSO73926.1 MAG: phosphoribulokinase [Cyanobacteria bacterium QH_8_48_120]PSO78574.1 MAG: phosphoribulokinase [Cyanobacteria bacterium QH_3_48_4